MKGQYFMIITFEQDKHLSLIYLYLREFDGNIVSTIPVVRSKLLLDRENNWIGIEVFNDMFDEEKIELPMLMNSYNCKGGELVKMSRERIYILFDSKIDVCGDLEVACNIDFNDLNGLLGLEFILTDFSGKLDIVRKFICNQ